MSLTYKNNENFLHYFYRNFLIIPEFNHFDNFISTNMNKLLIILR